MQHCGSNQKHGPLKTHHLIDDNVRCVFFSEHPLGFVGYITCQTGEGYCKYKIHGSRTSGKRPVYRYAHDRAGSPRSKGDKTAAKTGGKNLD